MKPVRPPTFVCAKPVEQPKVPASAGLVQAVTDTEKDAQEAFLNWVARLVDHDADLVKRAQKSADWCANP